MASPAGKLPAGPKMRALRAERAALLAADESPRLDRDLLPRGSTTLMLRVVQREMREAIYDGLCRVIQDGAAGHNTAIFLRLIELLGDRTEGKPTQTVVTEHRRATTFAPLDVTPRPEEAPPPGLDGQVDLAVGLPEAPPPAASPAPLPGPDLAVLPPPL